MDLATLALSMQREAFRTQYDCLFLCSDLSVAPPERPQATAVFLSEITGTLHTPEPGPPFVAAILKVQEQFPSMITVGRTQNNDVVVSDKSISKFHAFFRVANGGVEVADAGSRNGSFIGEQRLEKNHTVPVKSGDRIRLARLPFQLLDAGACWDWLFRAQDQWD